MTGIRETWRLTAFLTVLFFGFAQSYRLPGNSEYFGYDGIEDTFSHSPSSYHHSSHNPPALYSNSPPAYFDSSSLVSPLTFAYKSDSPATSPDPFYLLEEASSNPGWDGRSQISLPSSVKSQVRRPRPPAEMPHDEDESQSSDSDVLGLRNMEPGMQRIRSPFRERENIRPVVEQIPFEEEAEKNSGKIVVTMMSSLPRNSVPSFGRVVCKPMRSDSSRLQQENKRFNTKQKVDFFYVDGNGSKAPPTFPSFLSKMYRFAEPQQGNGRKHPETPSVGEMKGSEFYNIEQDLEEPVPADELTEAGDAREPNGKYEFGTEQIDQPLRDEDGEKVDEALEYQREERKPFMEFEEQPSQPTMPQEPRETVLKRPMSLSSNYEDPNKRPQFSSDTTKDKQQQQIANTNSNRPSDNSRSTDIEILRQQFEAVVQKYNKGLAALSRLGGKDSSQSKPLMKSPEGSHPKYGPPSAQKQKSQSPSQSPSQSSRSPHLEKPKSNLVDLEVRPSVHVDHHELSKSTSPLDSELLSIIQKLLKDSKLD